MNLHKLSSILCGMLAHSLAHSLALASSAAAGSSPQPVSVKWEEGKTAFEPNNRVFYATRNTLQAQSRDARATVYADLNREGQWEPQGKLLATTPGEEKQRATVQLDPDPYPIRIDYASGPLSSVLIVSLEGTGTQGCKEISRFLKPPQAQITTAAASVPAALKAGEPIDFSPLAMQPDSWKKAGLPLEMTP